MAIVGSSVVVGKIVVERVPVFLIGGLRFGLASLILLPLVLAREGLPRAGGRDVAVLALQAFTGIFAFNALLLYGLTFTSAAEGGLVTSTTPAVAAALAVLLLGEPWTRGRTAAVALAVLGLLAINATTPLSAGRGLAPLLGNTLVFGAVIGEGLFIVCSRVLAQRLSPLAVATGISVFGFLMFLPLAVWQAAGFDFGRLGAPEWGAIGYYAVVVTVIAFLCWAHGVARVPASTAAVFTGVLPVSAVGLSYLLLGEPFLWSHLLGGACVLAAIVMVARTT